MTTLPSLGSSAGTCHITTWPTGRRATWPRLAASKKGITVSDQWQMFDQRLGVPPCETSINHETPGSHVRVPVLPKPGLVYADALTMTCAPRRPTVRLMSMGFHHFVRLRRCCSEGMNSTCLEKSGGLGARLWPAAASSSSQA